MSQSQKPKVTNLLSNVSPPSELPTFITSSLPAPTTASPVVSEPEPETNSNRPLIAAATENHHHDTTFTAAIPQQNEVSSVQDADSPSTFRNMTLNPNSVSSALQPITQGGANLLGWMKGAVSSGGILQKVAEKAKSSVDTIVTTLDPQMKDYILMNCIQDSGGDFEVLVASDKEDKIRPIREAFQTVFGRATVTGIAAQPKSIATQPSGYQHALLAGYERIEAVRVVAGPGGGLPIVAVESFIIELGPNEWYEAGLLLVSDSENNINLKTITQMTPIPSSVITMIQAETTSDYEFKASGFSITVGQVMANNLQVHHTEWHHAYTTINRSEMILNAAKSLAGLYKQALTISEASTESAAATTAQ